MSRKTPLNYQQIRYVERKGFFPPETYQDILDAAAAANVDLTPYDFIAHLSPGRLRTTESAG